MNYERELPIKYCVDCDTHFYAPPNEHAAGDHDDGSFEFVRGDYKVLHHADGGVVRRW